MTKSSFVVKTYRFQKKIAYFSCFDIIYIPKTYNFASKRKNMIGRARTNLRAEIEDQYEILSFLVSDISSHYQEQVDDVEEKVAEFKKVNANEDYEIVSSELRNFYAASEICD